MVSKNGRNLRTGFCVDTGASSTVIGMEELRRLSSLYGKQLFCLHRSFKQRRFADASFTSLGRVDLPLATSSHFRPVFVTVYVVSADVPALLGFDLLSAESLVADTVMNWLSNPIVLRGRRDESGKLLEDNDLDDWSFAPTTILLSCLCSLWISLPKILRKDAIEQTSSSVLASISGKAILVAEMCQARRNDAQNSGGSARTDKTV